MSRLLPVGLLASQLREDVLGAAEAAEEEVAGPQLLAANAAFGAFFVAAENGLARCAQFRTLKEVDEVLSASGQFLGRPVVHGRGGFPESYLLKFAMRPVLYDLRDRCFGPGGGGSSSPAFSCLTFREASVHPLVDLTPRELLVLGGPRSEAHARAILGVGSGARAENDVAAVYLLPVVMTERGMLAAVGAPSSASPGEQLLSGAGGGEPSPIGGGSAGEDEMECERSDDGAAPGAAAPTRGGATASQPSSAAPYFVAAAAVTFSKAERVVTGAHTFALPIEHADLDGLRVVQQQHGAVTASRPLTVVELHRLAFVSRSGAAVPRSMSPARALAFVGGPFARFSFLRARSIRRSRSAEAAAAATLGQAGRATGSNLPAPLQPPPRPAAQQVAVTVSDESDAPTSSSDDDEVRAASGRQAGVSAPAAGLPPPPERSRRRRSGRRPAEDEAEDVQEVAEAANAEAPGGLNAAPFDPDKGVLWVNRSVSPVQLGPPPVFLAWANTPARSLTALIIGYSRHLQPIPGIVGGLSGPENKRAVAALSDLTLSDMLSVAASHRAVLASIQAADVDSLNTKHPAWPTVSSLAHAVAQRWRTRDKGGLLPLVSPRLYNVSEDESSPSFWEIELSPPGLYAFARVVGMMECHPELATRVQQAEQISVYTALSELPFFLTTVVSVLGSCIHVAEPGIIGIASISQGEPGPDACAAQISAFEAAEAPPSRGRKKRGAGDVAAPQPSAAAGQPELEMITVCMCYVCVSDRNLNVASYSSLDAGSFNRRHLFSEHERLSSRHPALLHVLRVPNMVEAWRQKHGASTSKAISGWARSSTYVFPDPPVVSGAAAPNLGSGHPSEAWLIAQASLEVESPSVESADVDEAAASSSGVAACQDLSRILGSGHAADLGAGTGWFPLVEAVIAARIETAVLRKVFSPLLGGRERVWRERGAGVPPAVRAYLMAAGVEAVPAAACSAVERLSLALRELGELPQS